MLRLTVRTDGQRSQTLLLLAHFEKAKHSEVESMTGIAVQRFWECSGISYQNASHQVCLHAEKCQRIHVKVMFRKDRLYLCSYSNFKYLCMPGNLWMGTEHTSVDFTNYHMDEPN